MDNYNLPKNERELLNQMKNYFNENLKISEDKLKNPTPEFLIEFYKNVLFEFHVDCNHVMQDQVTQWNVAEEFEMFSDMLPLLNLTSAIRNLEIPGLKDFTVFDLINPTPRKTFKNLSYTMRFIYYCDSRMSELECKIGRIDEMKLEKQEILMNIDQMKNYLTKRANEATRKRNECHEKNIEIERLTSELQELGKPNEELSVEVEDFKSHMNKVDSDLEALHKECQMIENDEKEFESQMKEMKRDISCPTLSTETLEQKVKDTSEKLNQNRENLRTKQELLDRYNNRYESSCEQVKLLKEAIKTINEEDEIQKNCETLINHLKNIKDEIEYVRDSAQSTANEIQKNEGKLTEIKLKWEKEELLLKESIAAAEKVYDTHASKYEKAKNNHDDISRDIKERQREFKENKNLRNSFVRAMNSQLDGQNNYLSQILEDIKNLVHKLKRKN